ncbi:MAG: histidine kinase [Proteobacteria bacterium ST_bin11]|nr:MAG: histidine kinase [Proteobacteria bacterium ST_bin11]
MKFKNFLSLKSLIVLGFVIAVIPLFLAVMYAAFGMRETSALGRTVNTHVFEQTKTIRLVLQKASDIERKAKLFVLLSDPTLRQPYERQSYETVRASFKQALNELLKLQVDNKIALLVNELSEKENLIYQQIIGTDDDNNLELPIDEAFQGLRESAALLSREFENHVDHEFNELHQLSESLEDGLLVKGAILLAISFSVIALLLIVLSRSMRQLDVSIRRLGAGELAEPVVVNGPADLRYLGNRLEWLRTHLLELEVSKQQFMQNVAREIELPLASLRQDAELLAGETDYDPNSKREHTALHLCANIEKLNAVSEELLRYSRINSLPDMKRKERVNVKGLLETVVEDFQPVLGSKAITIRLLARPVDIFGFPEQLRVIIEQLLTNAVKFSPEEGEIRIILRDAGTLMELEVEDEGPGIAITERDQIFQPFYRGKAGDAGDSDGPGLGLAIVKEYVANHQGKVEVIDARQDQQGARIRVQIPLNGES